MTLLHAGVDTAVIALWLGHADIRSTNAYLHADMAIKQRALDLTSPVSTPPGRYRPADPLLAFLGKPVIMPSSATPATPRSPPRRRSIPVTPHEPRHSSRIGIGPLMPSSA